MMDVVQVPSAQEYTSLLVIDWINLIPITVERQLASCIQASPFPAREQEKRQKSIRRATSMPPQLCETALSNAMLITQTIGIHPWLKVSPEGMLQMSHAEPKVKNMGHLIPVEILPHVDGYSLAMAMYLSKDPDW